MVEQKSIDFLLGKYKSMQVSVPSAHIVLGSGFGQALDALPAAQWDQKGEISFTEVPGLFHSTVPDHAGKYRVYKHKASGKTVQFQMGRLHGYEGHPPRSIVQTVMIPRLCGVENFLLTNAAGGLDLAMKPGDVMLIGDHVNMTGTNPLIGENPKRPDGSEIGPRFPDMGNIYQPAWRKALKPLLEKQNLGVHEGTYLGLMGPVFETHAEVRLFAQWGMKAVGMSTVWEAIVLKHSGAKLAGLSLISNMGAGLTDQQLDHYAILETCRKSAAQIITGVGQLLESEILK
jgi:purine-nucleoside phosphorylase